MDFLELCRLRRSVRAYQPDSVTEEHLDYILECVRLAPSACNRQPWRLRLLREKNDLERLAECYNRDWFRSAPACFILYCETREQWVRSSDGKPHGNIDVAIATEHLCLAAAEVGLGTCWICNFDTERLTQQFGSPEGCEPVALIPLGKPADEAKDKVRKSLDDILLK
ncbi:MAG: nitroreductase family protein [Alloprevotella sp.]